MILEFNRLTPTFAIGCVTSFCCCWSCRLFERIYVYIHVIISVMAHRLYPLYNICWSGIFHCNSEIYIYLYIYRYLDVFSILMFCHCHHQLVAGERVSFLATLVCLSVVSFSWAVWPSMFGLSWWSVLLAPHILRYWLVVVSFGLFLVSFDILARYYSLHKIVKIFLQHVL